MKDLQHRRGFTLVELLVVLGILICLMGMLLPVLSHVREEARRVKCLSNLHQLTTAWLEYAADNERHFCSSQPSNWGWVNGGKDSLQRGVLWQYVKNADVYLCPAARGDYVIANTTSFQINGLLAGRVGAPFPFYKLDELSRPSKTFVFIEGSGGGGGAFNTPIYPSFHLSAGGWPGENHHGSSAAAVGTGISFADGHAIFWPYSDPRTGNLLEAAAGPLKGFTDVDPNSPDVYQLEAWSGGPLPLSVAP